MSEAQWAMRQTGLTATDMTIVSGVSPWGHPLEVYAAKMGAPPGEQTLAMEMGHAVEPVVMGRLARKFGLPLQPGLTVRDSIVSWCLATPDRFVASGPVTVDGNGYLSGARVDAVCEGKLVGWHTVADWRDDEATDTVTMPAYVAVQTTWQMGVTRTRYNYLGALLGGWREDDFHAIRLELDEDLWGALREVGAKWWRDHVIARRPPSPDGSERAKEALHKMYPQIANHGLVEAPDGVVQLAKRYLDASAREVSAAKEKSTVANLLRAECGGGEGFVGNGVKVVWSDRSGHVSIAKIAEHFGLTDADMDKFRGAPTRMLRVAHLSKKELAYRSKFSAA